MVTRRTSRTIRRPRVVITQTSSSTRLSRSGRGRGKIIRTRASSISPPPRTFRKPAPPIRIAGTRKSLPPKKITSIKSGKISPVRRPAPPPRTSSRPKPQSKTFVQGISDALFSTSPEFKTRVKEFQERERATVLTTTSFPNRRGGVDTITSGRESVLDDFIFGSPQTKQRVVNQAVQLQQARGFREVPPVERAASNIPFVAGLVTGSSFAPTPSNLQSLFGFPTSEPNRKIRKGFIKKDREPRAIGGSALLSIDGFQGNPRFIGRFGTRFF